MTIENNWRTDINGSNNWPNDPNASQITQDTSIRQVENDQQIQVHEEEMSSANLFERQSNILVDNDDDFTSNNTADWLLNLIENDADIILDTTEHNLEQGIVFEENDPEVLLQNLNNDPNIQDIVTAATFIQNAPDIANTSQVALKIEEILMNMLDAEFDINNFENICNLIDHHSWLQQNNTLQIKITEILQKVTDFEDLHQICNTLKNNHWAQLNDTVMSSITSSLRNAINNATFLHEIEQIYNIISENKWLPDHNSLLADAETKLDEISIDEFDIIFQELDNRNNATNINHTNNNVYNAGRDRLHSSRER